LYPFFQNLKLKKKIKNKKKNEEEKERNKERERTAKLSSLTKAQRAGALRIHAIYKQRVIYIIKV
jgi:hypothetical protein